MAGALSEKMLETLTLSRGWRFRDPHDIHSLLSSPSPLSIDSIESELINLDLRDFGAKSLPDPSSFKKLPHFNGPLIVQVVSVRDIQQSTIDASFKSSAKRLLRFNLTDGFNEVIAIEYSPIISINQDIIPGTKVRLENKIPIHNGILCLSSKNFTVIGGMVESLYEEYKMNQKYSGLSRKNIKLSQNDNFEGPPPFEKLQAGSKIQNKMQKSHDSNIMKGETSASNQGLDNVKIDNTRADLKKDQLSNETEDKNSTTSTRTKEVIEAVPVQNQAASQKLLRKMQEPANNFRYNRGRGRGRNRGEREEESQVFTLEEWEMRNSRNAHGMRTNCDKAPDMMTNYNNNPGMSTNYDNAPDMRRNYDNPPGMSTNYDNAPDMRRNYDNAPDMRRNYDNAPDMRMNYSNAPDMRRNYNKAPDVWRNYVNAPDTRINYDNAPDTARDEEMARMLQHQMDLEDMQGTSANSDADRLRMSMFNFNKDEEISGDNFRASFRGRGRSRGRSRGRR